MAIFSRKVGTFLTAGAAAAAILALLVPLPGSSPGIRTGSSGDACPLGYTGADDVELPADHPPVADHVRQQDLPEQLRRRQVKDDSILFVNGRIWTGDREVPWVEAFRVTAGGQILEVGNSSELRAAGGGYSRVVDLRGRFVIPGFVDAHVHLMMAGLELQRLDLSAVSSPQQLKDAVAAAATVAGPGAWVEGHGWNQERWGGQLPEANWIDPESGDHPVFLTRMDVHSALVNSAAMRAAGITADTPDPVGGSIERDAHGNPTGILRDAAIMLIKSVMPRPTLEARAAALQDATDFLLARGITQVHDMGWAEFSEGPERSWQDLEEIFMPAANDGTLRLRIHAAMPLSTWVALVLGSGDEVATRSGEAHVGKCPEMQFSYSRWKQLAAMVEMLGWSHPGGHLSWGTVKGFSDGSLGSRTALMYEPYLDTSTTGLWSTNSTVLTEDIIAADSSGLRVAVHAIGDRAVDEVVARFEAAARVNGNRGGNRPRHRIEHVQHVAGERSITRLRDVGAYAVVNPLHLPGDKEAMISALGDERASARRSYAFKAMLEAGVPLASGSDWPVAAADALGSIFVSAFWEGHNVSGVVAPRSPGSLQLEEAIRVHTSVADTCLFPGMSRVGGVIREAQVADFVVLSGDPFSEASWQPPGRISVLETYVGGQRVFSAEERDVLIAIQQKQ